MSNGEENAAIWMVRSPIRDYVSNNLWEDNDISPINCVSLNSSIDFNESCSFQEDSNDLNRRLIFAEDSISFVEDAGLLEQKTLKESSHVKRYPMKRQASIRAAKMNSEIFESEQQASGIKSFKNKVINRKKTRLVLPSELQQQVRREQFKEIHNTDSTAYCPGTRSRVSDSNGIQTKIASKAPTKTKRSVLVPRDSVCEMKRSFVTKKMMQNVTLRKRCQSVDEKAIQTKKASDQTFTQASTILMETVKRRSLQNRTATPKIDTKPNKENLPARTKIANPRCLDVTSSKSRSLSSAAEKIKTFGSVSKLRSGKSYKANANQCSEINEQFKMMEISKRNTKQGKLQSPRVVCPVKSILKPENRRNRLLSVDVKSVIFRTSKNDIFIF